MGGHTFICHARTDSGFVLTLVSSLRSTGASVWVDQHDIKPGADWNASIDDAIDTCTCFLIVLSPNAKRREVQGELHRALNKDKPVVPLLYRPCDIPRQLLTIQCIACNGREADDPTLVNEILRAIGFTPPVTRTSPLQSVTLAPTPDSSAPPPDLGEWLTPAPAVIEPSNRRSLFDTRRFGLPDIGIDSFNRAMPPAEPPPEKKPSTEAERMEVRARMKQLMAEMEERNRETHIEHDRFEALLSDIAPDEFVVCPYCGKHVEGKFLGRHRSQNHIRERLGAMRLRKVSSGPTAQERTLVEAESKGDPESLVRCPACTNEIKRRNLIRHWNHHW